MTQAAETWATTYDAFYDSNYYDDKTEVTVDQMVSLTMKTIPHYLKQK